MCEIIFQMQREDRGKNGINISILLPRKTHGWKGKMHKSGVSKLFWQRTRAVTVGW
jgi:hypothetical protein